MLQRLRQAAADPVASLVGICLTLVATGFVVIFVAASRMASLRTPALQVPYIVSGGLTGFALIVFGTVVALVQLGRRSAAGHAAELASLADALDAQRQSETTSA